MIAVIDYDAGNLCSVANALGRLGVEYKITSSPKDIIHADKVLLPGVGEAAAAMAALRERGLAELIPTLTQPVLGICIGVQLMCRHSEESDTECLGIFPNIVKRFHSTSLKVPHIGWNSIENLRSPLFKGIEEGAYIYYVHSFAPNVTEQTIATTTYGEPFSAAIAQRNFYGTQFHPEKSAIIGERILENFLKFA